LLAVKYILIDFFDLDDFGDGFAFTKDHQQFCLPVCGRQWTLRCA
jgi:hypothetical protein